jgi:hypothetical protein
MSSAAGTGCARAHQELLYAQRPSFSHLVLQLGSLLSETRHYKVSINQNSVFKKREPCKL